MPDFSIQYDVDTKYLKQNGTNPSGVYRFIKKFLEEEGWTKSSGSCWRQNGVRIVDARREARDLREAVQSMFGEGTFRVFHLQRLIFHVNVLNLA